MYPFSRTEANLPLPLFLLFSNLYLFSSFRRKTRYGNVSKSQSQKRGGRRQPWGGDEDIGMRKRILTWRLACFREVQEELQEIGFLAFSLSLSLTNFNFFAVSKFAEMHSRHFFCGADFCILSRCRALTESAKFCCF